MAALFDDWRGLVRGGIMSYLEALRGLRDGRIYHGGRRAFDSSDWRDPGGDGSASPLLPLLWGTF